MAPLHGITDYTFRNIYAESFPNIDIALAPFVSVTSTEKERVQKFFDFFPENNKNLEIVPQIMANKSEQLLLASQMLRSLKYKTMNWNVGCPSTQVTKHGRGAGLLKDISQIDQILNDYFQKTDFQLNIKIRIGYSDNENFDQLIKILNKYPLEWLCIHPRLSLQMYDGDVDLETFNIAYENSNHRIIYSGDIDNIDFYNTLKSKYPKINDWMIGRGLLTNLNLINEISQNGKSFSIDDFKNLHSQLLDNLMDRHQNEKIVLGRLKELWQYFHKNNFLQYLNLTEILRSESIEDIVF